MSTTIEDILEDSAVPFEIKEAFREIAEANSLSAYTPVITPTASNDDVNGSQHASDGGTDFTYEDISVYSIATDCTTLGYYKYFSNYYGVYTGHYYNGDGNHFDAVVVNPPAYAVDVYV